MAQTSDEERRRIARQFLRAGEDAKARLIREMAEQSPFLRSLDELFPSAPRPEPEKRAIVTCPNCGQKNRAPISRLREARCGSCRAPLAS